MAMDAVSLQGVWLTSPVPSDESAATSASTAGSSGRVYRYERVPYNSRRDWLRDPRRTPARREERRELVGLRSVGARDPGLTALADESARRVADDRAARAQEIVDARRDRAKALRRAREWERGQIGLAQEREEEAIILAVLTEAT